MYTLLIVEDEDIIRQGLVVTIDWHSYGFTLIGTAENGVQALELVQTHKPDAVLTDIKMPFMDGIELLEAIRTLSYFTQVVLISGFEEFSYAKKGIEFGAFAYILKDSLHEDIARYFPRLRERLDDLSHNVQGELPSVIKRFEWNDEDTRWLSGLTHFCCVAVWMAAKTASAPAGFRSIDHAALFFRKPYYIFVLHGGNEYELQTALDNIAAALRREKPPDYALGAGEIKMRREDLSKSFLEAMKALDYCRLHRQNLARFGVIAEKHAGRLAGKQGAELPETAIMLCDKHALIQYLNGLFAEAMEDFATRITDIHVHCVRIFDRFLYYAKMLGSDTDHIMRLLGNVYTFDSYIDANNWMIDNVSSLCDSLQRQRMLTRHKSVSRAVSMIDDRFHERLYLEEISCYCYMTVSSFSAKFKEATGYTFGDYLRLKRITHACNLLRVSDLKVYEVAQECGYEDEKYFCRVFKSTTSLSPRMFRKQYHQ